MASYILLKKYIPVLLILLLLAGCSSAPAAPTETPVFPETLPGFTEVPTSAPTVMPTAVPTEAPTEAPAPSLYIPDVSVEDVILFFNEVCLDAEFVNSGDPSVLQKWTEPISYCVNGIPTEDDLETLKNLTQWLNAVEGFPGISQAEDAASANLRIHFCDQEQFIQILGDNFYGMDGGVTFWYQDNAIYDAIICYRTDLDQQLRNSVILEEIYNGLGPIQDTDLRSDSIIYSGFSQPQALTEMDQLILRLLYHPDMKCGMRAAECEAVIRQLYQ